ncbi:hypothetical protein ACWKT3_40500 [Streptomyces violaceus]
MLFHCVDERQASTNRKTKKIVKTPDKPESLVQYRLRLDKSPPQGVWKTTSLTTVPGACS